MKKVSAVIAVTLMLTSCQKFIDKIYEKDPIAKLCKLKSIKTIGQYDTYFQTFHNNKWGEPDSITYANPGTGTPSLYFIYDKKGRLIEHTNGDVGTHRYVYEANSTMPVRDTLLDYYTNIFVSRYTYDQKGRIVKLVVDWQGSDLPEQPREDYEIIYEYNEHGNLVKAGPINYGQYDDKVNLLRTSKVLQFIYRDYSLNNRGTATKYNKNGLPVLYDYSATPKTSPFLRQEIEYTCK